MPTLPAGDDNGEPCDAELDAADLVCTTPEKFDATTRRHAAAASGASRLLGSLALLLVDEVHTLAEPRRGGALEAGTVVRVKLLASSPSMKEVSRASAVMEAGLEVWLPGVGCHGLTVMRSSNHVPACFGYCCSPSFVYHHHGSA